MVDQRVDIAWSRAAIDDLGRFGSFLSENYPDLAARIAAAIVAKVEIIARHPLMGRPIKGTDY